MLKSHKLKLVAIYVSVFFINNAAATENNDNPNYCRDVEMIKKWEGMIKKYPEDEIIIKLYSMRIGLCFMVDRGVVPHDLANDIWNTEHDRSINQRLREDNNKSQKFDL